MAPQERAEMFIYGIIAFLIFGVITSAASTAMKMQVNDRVQAARFALRVLSVLLDS
jgi:hypothetical protein